ncbi:hypothetical protein V6R21_17960 [Limibacter armeniacum]|uniref:hypothetical protein n=1 Tax=Limibacter armeniacum TaxID=466084 RepID=UPI002FE5686C
MKNLKIYLLAILGLLALTTSCSDDDDADADMILTPNSESTNAYSGTDVELTYSYNSSQLVTDQTLVVNGDDFLFRNYKYDSGDQLDSYEVGIFIEGTEVVLMQVDYEYDGGVLSSAVASFNDVVFGTDTTTTAAARLGKLNQKLELPTLQDLQRLPMEYSTSNSRVAAFEDFFRINFSSNESGVFTRYEVLDFATNTPFLGVDMTYDDAGNITSVVSKIDISGSGNLADYYEAEYTYDNGNRNKYRAFKEIGGPLDIFSLDVLLYSIPSFESDTDVIFYLFGPFLSPQSRQDAMLTSTVTYASGPSTITYTHEFNDKKYPLTTTLSDGSASAVETMVYNDEE